MTDKEMRMAIAEAAGITVCPGCCNEIDETVCHCGDAIEHHGYDGHSAVPMGCLCGYADGRGDDPKHQWHGVPDYLNDLNAMHGAEPALGSNLWPDYGHAVLDMAMPGARLTDGFVYWHLLRATARQRAEAFLKTIRKKTK